MVGHNEAATLRHVLEQCHAAARTGDAVWFVDSDSTDDSAGIAAAAGVQVVSAPLGKGNAVAAAIARHDEGWLILVDADLEESERSIPAVLRDAAEGSSADMLVGQVQSPGKRRSVTPYLYGPMVRSLFPETLELDRPLSGFRALRAGLAVSDLPGGYGVEAHLNVQVALNGGRTEALPLGNYKGPTRGYTHIGRAAREIADALLGLALAYGRIGERGAWGEWAARVVTAIEGQPAEGADDAEYLRELSRLAAEQPP